MTRDTASILPPALETQLRLASALRAETQLLAESGVDLALCAQDDERERRQLAVNLGECVRALEAREAAGAERLKRARRELRDLKSVNVVLETSAREARARVVGLGGGDIGAGLAPRDVADEVRVLRSDLLSFAKRQWPTAPELGWVDASSGQARDVWEDLVRALAEGAAATTPESGVFDYPASYDRPVEMLLTLGLVERVGSVGTRRVRVLDEVFGEDEDNE